MTFNVSPFSRDIDSDGEEIVHLDNDNVPQNFTFWFALDVKVEPTDPQAVVEIEAACFVCNMNFVGKVFFLF
jgi:hypothetical protein